MAENLTSYRPVSAVGVIGNAAQSRGTNTGPFEVVSSMEGHDVPFLLVLLKNPGSFVAYRPEEVGVGAGEVVRVCPWSGAAPVSAGM